MSTEGTQVAKIEIVNHGPVSSHNLQCWVCNKRKAVYHMYPLWVFGPCWECESKLYGTLSRLNKFQRFLAAFGGRV